MSGIERPDRKIMEDCRLYVDNLTKPLGSLGKLEDMAVRLAGILGDRKPADIKKAIVIFGGDTAVDGEQNESKGTRSYREMALAAQGCGPVNAAARQIGASVFLIDVGMEKDMSSIPGVTVQKVIHGTHKGSPAMTEAEAEKTVAAGMAVEKSVRVQGFQAVGLGNIGERSRLSALAVTAAVMKDDIRNAASEQGYRVELGYGDIDFHREPLRFLAQVGSAEIAALFGFTAAACRDHMAVVFDNAVTGAAVLITTEIYPEAADYVFPSAAYDEPVHRMQMQKLGMKPFLHYDFSIDQGLGSAMGLSLLDGSLCMLNRMKTFGTGGVDVAEDGPGKGRQREDVK